MTGEKIFFQNLLYSFHLFFSFSKNTIFSISVFVRAVLHSEGAEVNEDTVWLSTRGFPSKSDPRTFDIQDEASFEVRVRKKIRKE